MIRLLFNESKKIDQIYSVSSTNMLMYGHRYDDDLFPTGDVSIANGTAVSIRFSPGPDDFLVAAYLVSPGLRLFKMDHFGLESVSYPDINPTNLRTCCISPDSNYIIAGGPISPYFTWYKRTGYNLSKLPDPSSLPIATVWSCRFSPGGTHIALGTNLESGVGGLFIYSVSGETLTRVTNISNQPLGTGRSVSWSSDGQYLAMTSSASPYFAVFKKTSATSFSKLTNPTNLPPVTAKYCEFSPDDSLIAVCFDQSPWLYIYKKVGDVISRVQSVTLSGSVTARGIAWSRDGVFLIINQEDKMKFYKRSGDTVSFVFEITLTVGDANYGPIAAATP